MAYSRPNIVFVMADDHAAHAVSCYDGTINKTPQIDRIAEEGVKFTNCFCTNSICTPSRAAILTGTYNHVNGVTTLESKIDARQPTFVSLLKEVGYETAIVGKWHLGHGGVHDPRGFDYWNILPGQGDYYDPELIEMGQRTIRRGYATNVITDIALEWLSARDRARPFCLLVHHKAPHRPWEPDVELADDFENTNVPLPPTFNDDYQGRAAAAGLARMRIDRDLDESDLKASVPPDLQNSERAHWKYQRYIKDYLRCVASLDKNVGRLLDYLDSEKLAADTVFIYTSDQGFFLGDHGWYDKRFMYEESLRMPFVMRYPKEIKSGTTCGAMVCNVDFAQTLLDFADVPPHPRMQGRSIRELAQGKKPTEWRNSIYYRYWQHFDSSHHVCAHYGIRTPRYKLVYYYGDGLGQPGASSQRIDPEWELFDLDNDPYELRNVYKETSYQPIVTKLSSELAQVQAEVGDRPYSTMDG